MTANRTELHSLKLPAVPFEIIGFRASGVSVLYLRAESIRNRPEPFDTCGILHEPAGNEAQQVSTELPVLVK